MRSPSLTRSPWRRALAGFLALATAAILVGCTDVADPDAPIRVGWAATIGPLDPAGVDTPGSFALLSQVHASLLTIEDGQAVPDLAESAEFTEDGEYTVILQSGLTFANGDELTSSDVVFSIERQLALQVEDGPWRHLDNLDEVEAVDDRTIVFRLGSARDAGFPLVLAGPAGLVLDEESFFADELTPDDAVLAAEAFGGPFSMSRSEEGDVTLTPFEDYAGLRPAASTIELISGDGDALATELRDGTLDVLTGRLAAETIAELADDDTITLDRAVSGRVRLLSFDLDLMPFGAARDDADTAKASAVRHAVADLVDREAIEQELGSNLIAPLAGFLPDGILGAGEPLVGLSGDGEGGPDAERAETALAAAGITEPVELIIHVATDLVGGPVVEEMAAIATQLERGGLFTVEIVETDAAGLDAARADDDVAISFTSLASATLDPTAYLENYRTDAALALGFSDAKVDELLARQRTEIDPAVREATLASLQTALATALPVLPISQGIRLVFSRPGISGVSLDDTVPLDLSALRR